MARPTKLTDELLQKASDYIYSQDDTEPGWKKDTSVIPTVEGFASFLGISRDTVYAWSETPKERTEAQDELYNYETLLIKHKEFSDILDFVKSEQSRMLVNLGLDGKYNATIAKLILSGKHGYVEKSETDVTSKGEQVGQPVDATLLDQFMMNVKNNTKQ